MKDQTKKLEELQGLVEKIGRLYAARVLAAQEHYFSGIEKALKDQGPAPGDKPDYPWQDWLSYAADFAQRSVLFLDIMRERGNRYLAHVEEGQPPLLAFQWEMVCDGRTFAKPVNYALIRIIPPEGARVDEKKRPFIIIDPRAGHGPGIGGFKTDSEVGVALQFGYPVYFVIFFPEPEPGQTILDVCAAEDQFVKIVVSRHPASPKPTIYGNCQGGWASMLVASRDPDMVGPIVINGAPMSYWSGSWSEGEGENPMRYSGGMLGGSWMSLLASDLGGGKFDGAHLVQNFENLNPANTLWNKYYSLWKNIDTEEERFLEFEKWWGGYFLMNEEEIRWIVDNLFIGNKLAKGEVKAAPGSFVDLKSIRTPIIIFSSKGDNITPPQQALNWIADVYSSTAEIKANGQVIVALLNEDVGHLGIFVSGKVARKEHTEIIETLDYIEMLRPGVYVMELEETSGTGKDKFLSSFKEIRLEDTINFNRLQRKDEKPFEVVEKVSVANENLYVLYGRPLVRSAVNEMTAQLGRTLHPLRVQHWFFSDLNPLMWPLRAISPLVRENRKKKADDNAFNRLEDAWSQLITGSLNLCRDLRDAAAESAFFQFYGPMAALGDSGEARAALEPGLDTSLRDLPYVKQALVAIGKGGYAEALFRIGALIGRFAGNIPLTRLAVGHEFVRQDKVLSRLAEDDVRRLHAESEVMALLEPERTLESLPGLLPAKKEREHVISILEQAMALEGITEAQKEQADIIIRTLRSGALKAKGAPRKRKERS